MPERVGTKRVDSSHKYSNGGLHHSRFAKVRPQQEFVHFKDLNGEVKIIKPADPEKLKLLHKEVAGE